MKHRAYIYPRGIKNRPTGDQVRVNVYRSTRNDLGIHYGIPRPIDDPIFRKRHRTSSLYRIKVTFK